MERYMNLPVSLLVKIRVILHKELIRSHSGLLLVIIIRVIIVLLWVKRQVK